MGLADSLAVALDSNATVSGVDDALSLIRDEFAVDRVSLFSFDGSGSFRLITSAGVPILDAGTHGPIELSTQLHATFRGEFFRGEHFDSDPAFSRAGDRLVADLGFRSGIAIPLQLGTRPRGALAITSRSTDGGADRILEQLEGVTEAMTLALHAADAPASGWVLVCHGDPLIGEGACRVIERVLPTRARLCTAPAQALALVASGVEPIDVVVCDSEFSGGRAHSFLRELRGHGLDAPAIVLASQDSPLGHHVAMRSGAAGYVRRSEGVDRLVDAVRQLSRSRPLGIERQTAVNEETAAPMHLTTQEARVLVLLERGLRFKQIASTMGIAESTSKGYARNVFEKLGVHSRAEAVYEARRQGIFDVLNTGARAVPVQSTEHH